MGALIGEAMAAQEMAAAALTKVFET